MITLEGWDILCPLCASVALIRMKKQWFMCCFRSYVARTVWYYFHANAGISMVGLSLQQAMVKCWTLQVLLRLKPVFQALPSVILWEFWKRRNSYKHRDVVTITRE